MSAISRSMTEAKWQAIVLRAAKLYGWKFYHTYDSRRSPPGFPDLVLVRPPRMLMVELKTDTGRLSEPQREWLQSLSACSVETYVWRPVDWQRVKKALERR